jgi:RNA polymerase sigma-70 factor (ECF subfamily)
MTQGEDSATGSPLEQDEWIEGLSRRVATAVRRHCPAWLASQTDDIAQNVLLKLIKYREKHDGKPTFSSVYVEKAASGAVVDEIRRACRRREGAMADTEKADTMESGTPGPERDSSSREIGLGIVDCLNRLIEPRRVAVTLYLNGCSVPEASRRLSWSLRRTESLVYRGLADLRGCLERKGLRP